MCSHYLENPEPQKAYYGNEEYGQGMGPRLRGPSKALRSVADRIQQMEPRMTFCEKNEAEWESNLGSNVETIYNLDTDHFGVLLITTFSIIR